MCDKGEMAVEGSDYGPRTSNPSSKPASLLKSKGRSRGRRKRGGRGKMKALKEAALPPLVGGCLKCRKDTDYKNVSVYIPDGYIRGVCILDAVCVYIAPYAGHPYCGIGRRSRGRFRAESSAPPAPPLP